MPNIDSNPSTLSEAARFGLDYAREQLAGKSILVLTGAGVSTESGIPDYRGEGKTERHPMTFDAFMGSEQARARYWARSYVGWSVIANAKPNGSHFALAQAESLGRISHIITQNVDSLHQQAGSKKITELHGRLDKVVCMSCRGLLDRSKMDVLIEQLNPGIQKDVSVEFTPDGDAEVEASASFRIPKCPSCFGILKPDVVFFGESVPTERVVSTMEQLERSDALLVAGSSLTVNSGMRFARAASKAGKPIVIVNVGPTRADDIAIAKIEAPTSVALEELLID
ncbi:SIR2 NAD-dependent protein deacetylases, SIR2 family [Microbacteriaceae bacterium]|jgi:NAD-dependent SIR2 family protein deacetylase